MKPTTRGFWSELYLRARLVLRLMADKRVSPLAKLLPVGALVYLFVPTDLLPILPFDDAAVLWLASTFFVELCPPGVVQEHMEALRLESSSSGGSTPSRDSTVVDAEYRDLDDTGQR